MIVMSGQLGSVVRLGNRWTDHDAIVRDFGLTPDRSQSVSQVTETIALLVADEPDTTNVSGSVCERGHCGKRGNQIGDIGHVDIDSSQGRATVHPRTLTIDLRDTAHALE